MIRPYATSSTDTSDCCRYAKDAGALRWAAALVAARRRGHPVVVTPRRRAYTPERPGTSSARTEATAPARRPHRARRSALTRCEPLLAMLLGAACHAPAPTTTPPRPIAGERACPGVVTEPVRFELLAETVGIVYTHEALLQRLEAISAAATAAWRSDEVDEVADDDQPDRVQLTLSRAASDRVRPHLDAEGLPFRVLRGSEQLVVGVTYPEIGAAAIDVPVMHLSEAGDGRIIVRLGAVQGVWLGRPAPDAATAARLDAAGLRRALTTPAEAGARESPCPAHAPARR